MKPLTQLQRKALFMGIRPAAIEVGEDPEVYRKRKIGRASCRERV